MKKKNGRKMVTIKQQQHQEYNNAFLYIRLKKSPAAEHNKNIKNP